MISGCANQQPPGGGEVDKIPPKVKSVLPKPNSTNFRGNSIVIEFDKYIDRRSFQDAFRISPQYKGEITYDFSGKSVEVKFDKPFYKINPNKTFVVNINSVLMDLHSNSITEPINFAFATGSKIDMAQVSGKVYKSGGKVISIFAYHIENDISFDPTKNIGDYVTETNQDGAYNLTNLAPGKYRLLAIQDDDKNLLYTTDRENYGVLPYDLTIADSASIKPINFFLKNILPAGDSTEDVSKYFKDSLNIVYTSVEYDSRAVQPDQSIFIFFNKFKPLRDDFISSFKITDENNNPEKVVYNWKNDSLVEVFSSNRFGMNKNYYLSFALKTLRDSVYNFKFKFRTVNINSFGEMKGSVQSSYDTTDTFPVKVEMSASNLKPVIKYSFDVSDTTFVFKSILEADYVLFVYIDRNHNNIYDYGNPFPFEYSEPFFVYPSPLNIKGGWTVENVVISFNKY